MNGGPVGMLLGYIFVGTTRYFVMVNYCDRNRALTLCLDRL